MTVDDLKKNDYTKVDVFLKKFNILFNYNTILYSLEGFIYVMIFLIDQQFRDLIYYTFICDRICVFEKKRLKTTDYYN